MSVAFERLFNTPASLTDGESFKSICVSPAQRSESRVYSTDLVRAERILSDIYPGTSTSCSSSHFLARFKINAWNYHLALNIDNLATLFDH